VILLVGAILLAVVIGYLAGGRLRNLESLTLRAWPLALVGLSLQLIPLPRSATPTLGALLLLASFATLVVFAFLNLRVTGMPIVVIGLLLNALVIGVNQGMPVTRSALVRSGQGELLRYLVKNGGAKHHLADRDDELLFLADSIPLARPVGQVVSIGDLMVYGGLVLAIASAMRRRSAAMETARLQGRVKDSPHDPPPDPPDLPPGSKSPGRKR
jgi:Family of unknown function (DUF5317)